MRVSALEDACRPLRTGHPRARCFKRVRSRHTQTGNPRGPSFGPWLRAAAGAVALAAGAVVVGRRIDFTALSAANIAWGWIAASLLLNLASILGKAVVWKITLEALPEGRRTRYAHVVPALFIGFLLNTVLFARVGEVARVAVLTRRTRLAGRPVPAKAVAGTVIAEQLLVGAALAITVLGLLMLCDLPAIATRLVLALIALVAVGGTLLYALARGARGACARSSTAWSTATRC